MCIVLLFLLVSNVFTVLFAMDYVERGPFPFHQVVHYAATGCEQELAKKALKNLHAQGKDQNVLSKEQTAAMLSAYLCVTDPIFHENQFEILRMLLSFDEKESSYNKKKIIEDLDAEQASLNGDTHGLKQTNFVCGSDFFINFYDDDGDNIDSDDDDDDNKESTSNALSRIDRVRKLIQKFE